MTDRILAACAAAALLTACAPAGTAPETSAVTLSADEMAQNRTEYGRCIGGEIGRAMDEGREPDRVAMRITCAQRFDGSVRTPGEAAAVVEAYTGVS